MLNVVDTLEAVFSRNYRVFIDVSSFLFIIFGACPLKGGLSFFLVILVENPFFFKGLRYLL